MPEKGGEVSFERLDVLDADVLLVEGFEQKALDNKLFAALPAVQDGRLVDLGQFDQDFAAALGFNSPLSIPFLLDIAVPRLAAATDGDASDGPGALPGLAEASVWSCAAEISPRGGPEDRAVGRRLLRQRAPPVPLEVDQPGGFRRRDHRVGIVQHEVQVGVDAEELAGMLHLVADVGGEGQKSAAAQHPGPARRWSARARTEPGGRTRTRR